MTLSICLHVPNSLKQSTHQGAKTIPKAGATDPISIGTQTGESEMNAMQTELLQRPGMSELIESESGMRTSSEVSSSFYFYPFISRVWKPLPYVGFLNYVPRQECNKEEAASDKSF